MIRNALLLLLLIWTWAIHVYHLGVFMPPPHSELIDPSHKQIWIPKEKIGINQLVLSGSPFERGLASGKFTRDLLFREESSLVERLRVFLPNPVVFRSLQVLMIRWFWGADQSFEPWMREEMDGVSRSAPREFDDLGNGYVRQLYYHGVHEVGQMMVDQTGDSMGCTVAAFPFKSGWIIGRNFDFEGGKVFDDEKIMKWVFPDQGNAYVSVVWAGMVGAVTGVNNHGVYLSLNAAGARDFRRYGIPTTLVLLKALQYANTADEAVEMIRSADTFITDIFMVSDRTAGKLYRVEKSPHHTEVIPLSNPAIVTNHLVSDRWKDDSINRFRRDELPSLARSERGENLIHDSKMGIHDDSRIIEERVLSILRDKGEMDGKPLQLGNRAAIDALIATHSVIYNGPDNSFFVSQGPSLVGPYIGFDLTESFRRHEPIVIGGFEHDPAVSDRTYLDVKQSFKDLSNAEHLIRGKNCIAASPLLESARSHFSASYNYSMTLGDERECLGDHPGAVQAWTEAQRRLPAYASERHYLERKLGREQVTK